MLQFNAGLMKHYLFQLSYLAGDIDRHALPPFCLLLFFIHPLYYIFCKSIGHSMVLHLYFNRFRLSSSDEILRIISGYPTLFWAVCLVFCGIKIQKKLQFLSWYIKKGFSIRESESFVYSFWLSFIFCSRF